MAAEARFTEVSLKRLLHCSEQQAAASRAAAGSGAADAGWCASPQAQHAVETAQQLARELTAAGCVTSTQDLHRRSGLPHAAHAHGSR
jgi:hypothetical protein